MIRSLNKPSMTPARTITVALVGNPNTGKTTLFNALAGMNQRVGNYPGVTVETKKGRCRHDGQCFDIIDLPGTYSLAARSPDEVVAVEVILGQKDADHKPDVVVTIVDASNLERNLYLTTQVFDLGVPVIVALNMMDVAEGMGLKIDVPRLQQKLGVPVVPLQANRGLGIEELKQRILETATHSGRCEGPTFPEAFEREVSEVHAKLGADFPPVLARRLLFDVGGQTERRIIEAKGPSFAEGLQQARQRLAQAGHSVPALEPRTRYAWIRTAVDGCVERPARRRVTWTDRIDQVLTNRAWGTVVFLAIMLLVFLSIFVGAQPVMELIGAGQTKLMELVRGVMPAGPFRSLIVDGVLKGVGSVVVFLPQILILFAFIALLEDCGYMARAAYLMDRFMSRAGLNGKSFIPMLSSVACAVPGVMAARVIENRRDRLATILVAPLMSCSARLPVYALLIGAFLTKDHPFWVPGLTLFCMYSIGLVIAPLVAFVLKRTLLRGETPPFVMEMPLYKVPSLSLVARRAVEAGWMFLRRAGTLILASMVLIWALLYFPNTGPDGRSYEDVVATLDAAATVNRRLLAQVEEALAAAEPSDRAALAARKESIEKHLGSIADSAKRVNGEWKSGSYLGRTGKALEPVVAPLGWDWRIGMAVLASFPAREVFVGVLGIVFDEGDVDTRERTELARFGDRLREITGYDFEPIFNVPVALSVMVFFALCCQCVSTLAVIRRETNSWRWPAFTFVYMTALAYVGALITYQVGSWLTGV